MMRLYLVAHDRYRVRKHNGVVVLCVWRDDLCQFETGRGRERRLVDTDVIAAVASFAHDGRARVRWTPFEYCYRAKHAPPSPTRVSSWVHPYRRRAA